MCRSGVTAPPSEFWSCQITTFTNQKSSLYWRRCPIWYTHSHSLTQTLNRSLLRVLNLKPNDVVWRIPNYRKSVILGLKELPCLDDRPVSPEERLHRIILHSD
ncbi:hypothetical protein AMELA_G00201390 [Ameiurus melas]|uniref:Uncharacterized protein n=1 Tax=Ameiurus melas TaxID=219545 RepID=A0A7J6A9F8_AMEME|nr:hypothetical protein AMELA_G00201390 [Ameiurus melas]